MKKIDYASYPHDRNHEHSLKTFDVLVWFTRSEIELLSRCLNFYSDFYRHEEHAPSTDVCLVLDEIDNLHDKICVLDNLENCRLTLEEIDLLSVSLYVSLEYCKVYDREILTFARLCREVYIAQSNYYLKVVNG